MLRWLNRSPECFLENSLASANAITLPQVDPDRRLRWSLERLYEIADADRQAAQISWTTVATLLGCKVNQLTGLKAARYATNIDLAMRIVQWTNRPSTDFMYLARW